MTEDSLVDASDDWLEPSWLLFATLFGLRLFVALSIARFLLLTVLFETFLLPVNFLGLCDILGSLDVSYVFREGQS